MSSVVEVNRVNPCHVIWCLKIYPFIFQSLRDIDYIIKDKLLLESILDMEFQESTDKKGFFYNGKFIHV